MFEKLIDRLKGIPEKSIRHELYKIALVSFTTHPYYIRGLCRTLMEAIESDPEWYNLPTPYSHMRKYPEIYKHKPKNSDSYWFNPNDKETRINILTQAIEETKS